MAKSSDTEHGPASSSGPDRELARILPGQIKRAGAWPALEGGNGRELLVFVDQLNHYPCDIGEMPEHGARHSIGRDSETAADPPAVPNHKLVVTVRGNLDTARAHGVTARPMSPTT